MPQIVVARLHWRDDGALLTSGIPKSTSHGPRCGRDRYARDSRAILVAILPDQVFDFGFRNNSLAGLRWQKTNLIDGWRLKSLARRPARQQQHGKRTHDPRCQYRRHPVRDHDHRPCMHRRNKCPSCECVVELVVTMVQDDVWMCQ